MKKFKETFVAKECRTEIDLDPPFYEHDAEEPNEVLPAEGLDYVEWGIPSIEINEAIGFLQSFKQKGANRVYFTAHEDHHGYYFYGVKLEEI